MSLHTHFRLFLALIKQSTFKGGYRFREPGTSLRPEVVKAVIPEEVILPLQQGFGEAVSPIAKIGDHVKAGQIIGINDASVSSPVHATVNGTVKDIRGIDRFGQSLKAVIISSDGSTGWSGMGLPNADPESSDPDEIGRILYLSGVASLGSPGFPTRYNTSSLQPDDVKSLIINAVDCEPFALSNSLLLSGRIDKFLTGLGILRRALGDNVEIYVVISDNEIINALNNRTDWLQIHPVKPRYPQNHPVILAQTVLNRDIPYGGSICDMGVVVMDVQSVLYAYEAVVEGKPVIDRVISLGGSGLGENMFLRVRIGTTIRDIVEPYERKSENRYIYGGVMTGKACDDLSIPVDRTVDTIAVLKENRKREFLSFLRPGVHRDSFSNTFLSYFFPHAGRKLDTNEHGEHRPCIYCNYCESVCPVDLMPYLLNQYVTHDMLEEASRHRILACIDCGLCTYVCPSKIPLMTNIQTGKAEISCGNQ
jgi:Na(+)-translocating NADH:ubiquinone oxidoreductase A subunit